MQISRTIATYVSPNETIVFQEAPRDRNKIQAQIGIAGGIIASQVEVQIPERQASFCQGFVLTATKVQQLLKNRHLRPTYDPELKQVRFQPLSPDGKVWEKWGKLDLPTGVELWLWICRSNGTISYADKGTVYTWDWVNNKKTVALKNDTICTALAETPDGSLIIGDEKGCVHFKGKTFEVSEGKEIQKISLICESCFLVGYDDTSIVFDFSSESKIPDEELSGKTLVLGDGRIVVWKKGEVGFFTYDAGTKKFAKDPLCFENIDAINPISDTRFAMLDKSNKKAIVFDVKGNISEICFKDNNFAIYKKASQESGKLAWLGNEPVIDASNRKFQVGFYSTQSSCFSICFKTGDWFARYILALSDKSIMFGTDSEGSAIHVARSNQTTLFSELLKKLIGEDIKITSMKESLDGSVVICSYHNKLFVISPKIEQSNDTNLKIERIRLDLKYDMRQHDLYKSLWNLYSKTGQQAPAEEALGCVAQPSRE